jgi:hypothetical protein
MPCFVSEIEDLESDLDKRPHLSIGVAGRADIPEINIIARSAFVTGRFILDANIDRPRKLVSAMHTGLEARLQIRDM